MFKLFNTTLAIAVLSVMSVPAFAGVSGGIGYASDYGFRGQTQTQGEASLYGHVDVDMGGFYAGIWTGEVDFDLSLIHI